jgi:hypothetical protein
MLATTPIEALDVARGSELYCFLRSCFWSRWTISHSGALFVLTTIYQYLRKFESTVSDTRSNVEEVYYSPINKAMFVITKAFTDMFKEQDLELYG